MSSNHRVDLGAQEEHLQGVLIGQDVPVDERQHFNSFEIVLAQSTGISPAQAMQNLLKSFRPVEIARYAHEVEGYVQKFGVKEVLKRVLNKKGFAEV